MILLLAFPVAGAVAQPGADADSIKSARAASNRAIAGHDVGAIVAFLDDEYVITDSTGHIEFSRQSQTRIWAEHFAAFPDVVYVRTPSNVAVSEAFPHALERGTWVGSRTTDQGWTDKGGEYSAVWRKVGGVWKVRSEMFVAMYCRGKGC